MAFSFTSLGTYIRIGKLKIIITSIDWNNELNTKLNFMTTQNAQGSSLVLTIA